jgi:large subunit ribosomal protein L17
MRHRKAGRQLRRTSEQRLALLRSLAVSLIEEEAITTTQAKAKELRPFIERLITKAKSGTLHDRRMAMRHVRKRDAADKLFRELGPRFAKRPGGYTRILRTGHRKGDGAEMALIELMDGGSAVLKAREERRAKSQDADEGDGDQAAASKKSAGRPKAKSARAAGGNK